MRYLLMTLLGVGLLSLNGLPWARAFADEKPATKKAADTKKEGTKKEAKAKDGEEVKLESREEKSVAGTTVNFASTLQLPFPGLTTLGARIEQSRTAADPVGLSQAAVELGVAEKVSGKKAAITSQDLTKEAVELAKLRGRATELKAVAMTTGVRYKAGLEKAIAKAEKKAAEKEAPRGITSQLVVYNRTGHHLHVYVNGEMVGHVDGHSHAHFNVHTHGHTHLSARGGGHKFRHHFTTDYRRYNWTVRH